MTPSRTMAIVVGARPNFIKVAPVLRALSSSGRELSAQLVHTGQHSSHDLSQVFFDQLAIRPPDVHLGIGSGTHGEQTARVMQAFEKFLLEHRQIQTVMVVGDVNSTLAAALATTKLQIPLVHLEAGLRSFDRSMPEEINRLATDAIADLLLVSEPAGELNLRNEGVPPSRIRYVGNVMIDTLIQKLPEAKRVRQTEFPALKAPFGLLTAHRPSNVDHAEKLAELVEFLACSPLPFVFPVHPRTRARLEQFGLWESLGKCRHVTISNPLGYLQNLALLQDAAVVLTDSGGIQEEATCLGVPCLTLRANTERPATITMGTNTLVGWDFKRVAAQLHTLPPRRSPTPDADRIPGWDGHASERVIAAVDDLLSAAPVLPSTSTQVGPEPLAAVPADAERR